MEDAGQPAIEAKHIRVVHYYARRYVRANHIFYDDCVSAGMLALMRALNTYDASKLDTFDAYLHVCVNRAIEREYQALRSKEALPLLLEPLCEIYLGDSFEDLIKYLPKELKQVLTLYYVEGLSQNEISDKLGYTRQWVASRLKEALQELRHEHL